MPGVESGRITRMNAPIRVAPSTKAASSRSCGTPSKKEIMIHTMSGMPTMRWVSVRAR